MNLIEELMQAAEWYSKDHVNTSALFGRAADTTSHLLEALKEYLDWHEANFALPSGNFEDPDQMALARNARAAVAKAEGSTPNVTG